MENFREIIFVAEWNFCKVCEKCFPILSTDALVQKLLPLGFTRAAIRKELIETNGDLNEAANNLLYQLPDSKAQGVLASIKKEEKKFIISSVEV